MRSRYIYVENNSPARSGNPEKSFAAFVDAIQEAIVTKVREKEEEGSLNILQLYSWLDYPQINEGYDRMIVCFAYEIVKEVKELANKGILRLETSSWGDKEVNEENRIDTQPGLEDMEPDSLGFNNNGGPTYSITVSKERIDMEAGFCYQDFSGSWDIIDTSYKWQHRKFTFVPANDDDETLKQMLTPFKNWIIYRFSNRIKRELLDDIINQVADTYLDRFLKR
jgi:hypothetical protein